MSRRFATASVTPIVTRPPFASQLGSIAVSFYPGHMAKSVNSIAELVRRSDVVIEVRDARLPVTTASGLLDGVAGLGRGRMPPRLIVFNKADLADAQLQGRVLRWAESRGHAAIFTSSADAARRHDRVLAAVDALGASSRAATFRAAGVTMLVVGVPNVGKSSLINALRGRAALSRGGMLPTSRGAKTGAAPGVTRIISPLLVRATPPLYLFDSPGVLPPRISSAEAGVKLALAGAVPDAAVPWLLQAEYLLWHWAGLGSTAVSRYGPPLGLTRAYGEGELDAMLAAVSTRALPRGAPDLEVAARHVVALFRAGALGRYTLDAVPPPNEAPRLEQS